MGNTEKKMNDDWVIDDFFMVSHALKKIGAEYFEHEPWRCGLFEVMFGEIHNKLHNLGDHALADESMPDIIAYTENDVIRCLRFEELPEDWQRYALACIKHYFE